MKHVVLITLLISSVLMLQGCVAAAIIGAGAGTTAKVATDPRTTGTQVDDNTLNARVDRKLKDNSTIFIGSRIVATAYNGNILLTGQGYNSQITKAESLASSVDGVHKVFNQIRSGDPVDMGTMTNDAWITTKVKSQLVANTDTKARNIKVVTENGEVFLIGIVANSQEGKAAANVASRVAGVKRVITAFTYE